MMEEVALDKYSIKSFNLSQVTIEEILVHISLEEENKNNNNNNNCNQFHSIEFEKKTICNNFLNKLCLNLLRHKTSIKTRTESLPGNNQISVISVDSNPEKDCVTSLKKLIRLTEQDKAEFLNYENEEKLQVSKSADLIRDRNFDHLNKEEKPLVIYKCDRRLIIQQTLDLIGRDEPVSKIDLSTPLDSRPSSISDATIKQAILDLSQRLSQISSCSESFSFSTLNN